MIFLFLNDFRNYNLHLLLLSACIYDLWTDLFEKSFFLISEKNSLKKWTNKLKKKKFQAWQCKINFIHNFSLKINFSEKLAMYIFTSWNLKTMEHKVSTTSMQDVAVSIASMLYAISYSHTPNWFEFRVVLLYWLPLKAEEPSLLYYFTSGWWKKQIHTFPKGISVKWTRS